VSGAAYGESPRPNALKPAVFGVDSPDSAVQCVCCVWTSYASELLPMLLTVSRFLAFCIGVLAYYIAFFMYEDEEGKWQNRIEKLWVAINDKEKSAGGSQASAFFNKVADVATRGFNRVLGRRLFSLQLVGVSTSYSFAALFLGMGFFVLYVSRQSRLGAPLPHAAEYSYLSHFLLIIGSACLLLAVLPALMRSRWSTALSLLPLSCVLLGLIRLLANHSVDKGQVEILMALALSVLSDVLLLALVRLTVRRVSENPSISRIAVAVLIQACVISLFIAAPWETSEYLRGTTGRVVLGAGIFNAFTGVASSVFLITLLFVLLHRVIWPVLSRLFYPLARHEFVHNRKIMAGVGTGCFIYALPLMSSHVAKVLEWLAG
jgi:hypothetical protein